MITTFAEMLSVARSLKGLVVGVPSPEDSSSIKTVLKAKSEGLADFILCGRQRKIIELITTLGGKTSDFTIIDCQSEEQSAALVVDLAKRERIHVIMKGFLSTAVLMKPVLDKKTGLRSGNLLSDLLIVENPHSHQPELLGMTDGGLNILPDINQKKQILENGVEVFHRLGYPVPRVGIMAAVETVKDAMPATVDARDLTLMNQRREISGCEVYGPLALDIAISPEAASHKGITHPVAGRVQIMVVPNIESGNLLGKAFMFYLKLAAAHVVMGARIPILIPSRNEDEENKMHSVALGVIIANQ